MKKLLHLIQRCDDLSIFLDYSIDHFLDGSHLVTNWGGSAIHEFKSTKDFKRWMGEEIKKTQPDKEKPFNKPCQPTSGPCENIGHKHDDHLDAVRYGDTFKRVQKEKQFPSDQTPCLVFCKKYGWILRYSDGKGKFYGSGKEGCLFPWDKFVVLDQNNLPV